MANGKKKRSKSASWAQRALEPGSQDPFPPDPPTNVDVVGSSGPLPNTNQSTTTPPGTGEICAGPDLEELDHSHQDAGALAHHLQAFLGHSWPTTLIDRYGIELVNIALSDLANSDDISSPPAFLNWRLKQLAAGSAPIRKRSPAKPEASDRMADRLKMTPEEHETEQVWRREALAKERGEG